MSLSSRVLTLVVIHSTFTLGQFLEEVLAPNLASSNDQFKPRNHISNTFRPSYGDLFEIPKTLHQQIRNVRKISEKIHSSSMEAPEMAPRVVTLSNPDILSLKDQSDRNCEYQQVDKASEGEDCAKGGMRCERKCEDDLKEPVCLQTLQAIFALIKISITLVLTGCLRRCAKGSM